MAKFKIESQISLLAVIIAAAVITSGYFAWKNLSQIVDSIHQEARPDNKLFLIKDIATDLSAIENIVRLYVLTNNEENLHEEKSPDFSDSSILSNRVPLFVSRENPDVLQVKISVPDTGKIYQLATTTFYFTENSSPVILESVKINHSKNGEEQFGPITDNGLQLENNKAEVDATAEIGPGNHTLSFGFQLKDDAILTESFSIENVELQFDDGSVLNLKPESEFAYRPANVVRAAGQDNCDTYRIPGMVTTGEGTLIAVYDNRYNNSKDLQEDINVGMSRSTDGGQTWEPMKVIMDMGEWGGNPERLNGIGDPAAELHSTTARWFSLRSLKPILAKKRWMADNSPLIRPLFTVKMAARTGILAPEPNPTPPKRKWYNSPMAASC